MPVCEVKPAASLVGVGLGRAVGRLGVVRVWQSRSSPHPSLHAGHLALDVRVARALLQVVHPVLIADAHEPAVSEAHGAEALREYAGAGRVVGGVPEPRQRDRLALAGVVEPEWVASASSVDGARVLGSEGRPSVSRDAQRGEEEEEDRRERQSCENESKGGHGELKRSFEVDPRRWVNDLASGYVSRNVAGKCR